MAASLLVRVYDVSGTAGGPIVKDRLWYFVTAHRGGSTTESTNVYYNINARDSTRWLYAPDVSRKEYSDRLFENTSARVTWLMTPGSKVGAFLDEQAVGRTCTRATSAGIDPRGCRRKPWASSAAPCASCRRREVGIADRSAARRRRVQRARISASGISNMRRIRLAA